VSPSQQANDFPSNNLAGWALTVEVATSIKASERMSMGRFLISDPSET
jgi:hypothetical protein